MSLFIPPPLPVCGSASPAGPIEGLTCQRDHGHEGQCMTAGGLVRWLIATPPSTGAESRDDR